MTVDLFLALVVFAFVMSVTPGPNNVMLLASGVNYGFQRSIPHMLGITFGFSFMIVVVGLGLGQVFERYPITYEILRYAGGAYMLWLAWKIANSGPVGEGKTSGSPLTFLQAALFQWVNPKAWVITISAIATYTPGDGSLWPVLIVALVCGVVNFPTIGYVDDVRNAAAQHAHAAHLPAGFQYLNGGAAGAVLGAAGVALKKAFSLPRSIL